MSDKDLFISGETIQRLYGDYLKRRLLVNRCYQRKLVWSIEEKISFIEFVIDRYPVPLILLAQKSHEGRSFFEIIDGLQRMNAVMSFIEGEFPVGEAYFDLNAIAETKELLDAGTLAQRTPVLDRPTCTTVAGYPLPVSIYGFYRDEDIDEIFRRINSNGRYLSPQELRSAGSLSAFATLVRQVATVVRGDVSAHELCLLNDMKKISITNKDLPYGILVDNLFWIHHNILTKDMVRELRDEEIIADLLAHMCLDEMQPSRKEALDEYFLFSSSARSQEVENGVKRIGEDVIRAKFVKTFDELRTTLDAAGCTFSELLFGTHSVQRIPRYFEVIFMALFDLMFREEMVVRDRSALVAILRRARQHIDVGSGGGTWSAQNKQANVNAIKGLLRTSFMRHTNTDPAYAIWSTQLETILRQSYTEQSLYEFKQGTCRLDGSGAFDEGAWSGVLHTIVGIANHSPGATGYVLIGIADKEADARRIEELHGISCARFDTFNICGVEADCKSLARSADSYFLFVVDKIKNSGISDSLRASVARRIRLVRYHDRSVLVIQIDAQSDPAHVDGRYFERHGPKTVVVDAKDLSQIFARFYK